MKDLNRELKVTIRLATGPANLCLIDNFREYNTYIQKHFYEKRQEKREY